jgi:small subunit ribosomal protein S14
MRNPTSSLLIGTSKIQIHRDIKNRILFDIYENERRTLKSKIGNVKIPLSTRLKYQTKLDLLPGTETKIKNRCMITGRSRSTYRHFKLSRIMIRELASYGLLPGVTKSSW